jgi:hypothetical protein
MSVLDAIADAFNPLLALFALILPFLRAPRRVRPILLYYVSAGVAIAMVYAIRAMDARLHVWAAMGLDYSTHSAFAASLAVSIMLYERRARVPVVALVVAYFALVMFLRYHTVGDISSSALVAAAIAFVVNRGTSIGTRF